MCWHHESKYTVPSGLAAYGVGVRLLGLRLRIPPGGINKGCVFCYSFRVVSYVQYSNQLTPWCRVLEKLTGLQLVKKFPAFHGTRRFITALTSVRHLSLSWATPIQSIYPHPTPWRSILILSTQLNLGLPSGFFPSGFPTKTLYTLLSLPIRATCPAHLIGAPKLRIKKSLPIRLEY